jgi:hypothetical protein
MPIPVYKGHRFGLGPKKMPDSEGICRAAETEHEAKRTIILISTSKKGQLK